MALSPWFQGFVEASPEQGIHATGYFRGSSVWLLHRRYLTAPIAASLNIDQTAIFHSKWSIT